MKKQLSEMAFATALMLCTATFVACGSDDDEENGGSNSGTTSQHISKITLSDGEYIETTSFEYDSQGRVVKKTETETSSSRQVTSTTTYTYSDMTIISKMHSSYYSDETHTYTLSDGRITKERVNDGGSYYTYEYTYDKNGYITGMTPIGNDDSPTIEFIWTNGNLTKILKTYIYNIESNSITISYSDDISYSNIPWPRNWMHFWNGMNMDKTLEPIGAWGKMPKNLPVKFISSEGYGWTIDYTVEKGKVVKKVYQDTIEDESHTYIETYEWQ